MPADPARTAAISSESAAEDQDGAPPRRRNHKRTDHIGRAQCLLEHMYGALEVVLVLTVCRHDYRQTLILLLIDISWRSPQLVNNGPFQVRIDRAQHIHSIVGADDRIAWRLREHIRDRASTNGAPSEQSDRQNSIFGGQTLNDAGVLLPDHSPGEGD